MTQPATPSAASMYRCIETTLRMIIDVDDRQRCIKQKELELYTPIDIPLLHVVGDLMPIQAVEVSTGVRESESSAQAGTHSCITFDCPFGDDQCSALHVVVLDHTSHGIAAQLRHPFVKCLDHALRVGNWKALHEFTITKSYAGFRLVQGPRTVFCNVDEGVFPLEVHGSAMQSVGGISIASVGSRAFLQAVTGSTTPRLREMHRVGRKFAIQALLWQHMIRYWSMQKAACPDPELMQYLAAAFRC